MWVEHKAWIIRMNRAWLESQMVTSQRLVHVLAMWRRHSLISYLSTLSGPGDFSSSQIKFGFFFLSQLVFIFTQMEVTRINIKAMHSKRKPPLARRRSNRGYPSRRTWPESDCHMSVNLKVLNFGLDLDRWVTVIRNLRSFGGTTEHHWWLSL